MKRTNFDQKIYCWKKKSWSKTPAQGKIKQTDKQTNNVTLY